MEPDWETRNKDLLPAAATALRAWSGDDTVIQLTAINTDPDAIPDCIAGPQSRGLSTTPLAEMNHDCCAWVKDGKRSEVLSNGRCELWIMRGATPAKNNPENTNHAKRRLNTIPIISTHIFAKSDFDRRLFGHRSSGVSHSSRTNHQIGSQLSVYCVPYRSFQRILAFGGIPIQNSRTRTPTERAARKWPSSCTTTTRRKSARVTSIERKINIKNTTRKSGILVIFIKHPTETIYVRAFLWVYQKDD